MLFLLLITKEEKMLKGKKIAIIGGGKMGGVIINGIITRQLAPAVNVIVADKVRECLQKLKDAYGVATTADNKKAAQAAAVVILAVKPQDMGNVLQELSPVIDNKKVVISIAAGISTGFIEGYLKEGVRVIRVMPNTPALIGEGAAALTRGKNASEKDLELAELIFKALGITVVVKEELMDTVTGLSGSGPAYGFLIIEALTDAGVLMGLSRDVSLKLAAQTMLGAAKLCLQSGKHPAELKDMVTSPGGTTIAALKVLEDGKIRAILMAAVEAATLRSRELGGHR
jgi:pyrroline-5-carboxylate reductase